MDYREYLLGLGLADKTVKAYGQQVERAKRWTDAHNVKLMMLTPSQTREMADTWPRSNASRRQVRAALRHYWTMHGVAGPLDAIRVPKRPKPRWRGLEDDQVRQLLATARADWPRGGAVYLGAYLALRREEIATLRWADFDDDLGWVTILGKGDRTRYLPVHPALQSVLRPQRWPGEFVFPGRLGGHVTLATINKWISEMGVAAGIGHIYPHRLRHTSGGKVNTETRDIYAAQGWLGHADVSTTEGYSRLDADRLVASMWALDWEDGHDGEQVA